MIEKVRAYLRQAVWLTDTDLDLALVYAALCHLAPLPLRLFATVPYLNVAGPSGSGKSTLGRSLAGLTGGFVSGGRSAPALFRLLNERHGRPIILDEGEETLRGSRREDFESILLNGDYIEGTVERATLTNQRGVLSYSVYGPKVIIAVRGIDLSALFRRAILVEMNPAPLEFIPHRDFDEERTLAQELQTYGTSQADLVRTRLEAHRTSLDFSSHGERRRYRSQAHRSLWAPMLAIADVLGLNLGPSCEAQGDVLEARADLDLPPALQALLRSLSGGRYYLTDLRRHLQARYGAKADFWSHERIGRTLRQLGFRVRRDGRGRYTDVGESIITQILRKVGGRA